jgi:hypothetical protein
LGKQVSSAELSLQIIRVSFDGRAVNVVRVLKSFEVDQRTGDQCQLARGSRIVVRVIFDERFVDRFGAIFLPNQVEHFGAAQVAFEFISMGVRFRRVGGGAFKLCDSFGVTAGDGEYLGELVMYWSVFRSLQ